MSDALLAVHSAVVAALETHPALATTLTGVFDGPPPAAAWPYVSIGNGAIGDWSTKTARGREIILSLTVWDSAEEAARLPNLMAAVEDAVAAIPRDLPGWRVASLVFLRSRIVRDPAGPWAGLIDHRIRILEV